MDDPVLPGRAAHPLRRCEHEAGSQEDDLGVASESHSVFAEVVWAVVALAAVGAAVWFDMVGSAGSRTRLGRWVSEDVTRGLRGLRLFWTANSANPDGVCVEATPTNPFARAPICATFGYLFSG